MPVQLRWPLLAGTLQGPQKTGRGRRKPAQAVGQSQKLQNLNDEVLPTAIKLKNRASALFTPIKKARYTKTGLSHQTNLLPKPPGNKPQQHRSNKTRHSANKCHDNRRKHILHRQIRQQAKCSATYKTHFMKRM